MASSRFRVRLEPEAISWLRRVPDRRGDGAVPDNQLGALGIFMPKILAPFAVQRRVLRWPFDEGALYDVRFGRGAVLEGSRGSGGNRGLWVIEVGPTLPFC